MSQKTILENFFGTSAFNTVVRWRKLGEVENECISHNFRQFAIFFAKNYPSWRKFDEFMTKQFCLVSFETWCILSDDFTTLEYNIFCVNWCTVRVFSYFIFQCLIWFDLKEELMRSFSVSWFSIILEALSLHKTAYMHNKIDLDICAGC